MARILTVDTIETQSGGNLSSNWPSGMIIGSKLIRNATRTSVSNGSGATTLFSGTYTKILGGSASKLIIRSSVFGTQFSSGNCGTGHVVNGDWVYGVAYQYDGQWSSTQQTTVCWGQTEHTGVSSGSVTVGWGWNPIGGGAERPFAIFNPNNSDDSRNVQKSSCIFVQEVVI
jgi:hypothetical protein